MTPPPPCAPSVRLTGLTIRILIRRRSLRSIGAAPYYYLQTYLECADLDDIIDEFESFDVRGDFTREYDNAVLIFHLYSAPTAEESQNGFYHHSDNRTYGYQQ